MSYETPQQASTRLAASKLTPQLAEIFCNLVAQGNYYTAACKAVGISYATFRSWMAMGEASDDPTNVYREFFLRVREADGLAEVYAVSTWRKHFTRDYRAARDFLARRHPERWAEQQRLTVAVDNEVQRILEVLRGKLDAPTYAQVIQALATVRDEEVLEAGEKDTLDDLLNSPFAEGGDGWIEAEVIR